MLICILISACEELYHCIISLVGVVAIWTVDVQALAGWQIHEMLPLWALIHQSPLLIWVAIASVELHFGLIPVSTWRQFIWIVNVQTLSGCRIYEGSISQ
jgi:hypothetical protein